MEEAGKKHLFSIVEHKPASPVWAAATDSAQTTDVSPVSSQKS